MAGVSYTADPKERTAEEVARDPVYPEKREKGKKEIGSSEVRARNIRRMASPERSGEEVMRDIIDYAQKPASENKRPWVVVMDGALHLWGLIAEILSGIAYTSIPDIIHVTEYLWAVGNSVCGEKTPERKQWVYDNLLLISEGRAGGIGGSECILREEKLKSAQRKATEDAARYFEKHREQMKYDQYLKAGYPIGSGVVESTCGRSCQFHIES